MHGSAELMVDRFNRGAGACAGPRSTTVRESNAEAHHNPPTSMRSLFRFPLLRRVAASFNLVLDPAKVCNPKAYLTRMFHKFP
jgi:hypothetical protein